MNKKYKELSFTTATDFMNFLSPMNGFWSAGKYIFRGQGDSQYTLTPSVCRRGAGEFAAMSAMRIFGRTAISQIDFEFQVLRQFLDGCDKSGLVLPGYSGKLKTELSHPFGRAYDIAKKWPSDDLIEVLAVAQHHGVPTRLLDWSRRSFVAAYFAATSASYRVSGKKFIAVWGLDVTNQDMWGDVEVVDVPGGTSKNLAAQSGVFTMQVISGDLKGDYIEPPLEETNDLYLRCGDSHPSLIKMTLPIEEVPELVKICSSFGVSGSTLFPGYEGVARDVQEWARECEGVLRVDHNEGAEFADDDEFC